MPRLTPISLETSIHYEGIVGGPRRVMRGVMKTEKVQIGIVWAMAVLGTAVFLLSLYRII